MCRGYPLVIFEWPYGQYNITLIILPTCSRLDFSDSQAGNRTPPTYRMACDTCNPVPPCGSPCQCLNFDRASLAATLDRSVLIDRAGIRFVRLTKNQVLTHTHLLLVVIRRNSHNIPWVNLNL